MGQVVNFADTWYWPNLLIGIFNKYGFAENNIKSFGTYRNSLTSAYIISSRHGQWIYRFYSLLSRQKSKIFWLDWYESVLKNMEHCAYIICRVAIYVFRLNWHIKIKIIINKRWYYLILNIKLFEWYLSSSLNY